MRAGIAMLLGSATPYVGALDFVVIAEVVFIRVKERMLEETFGEAYRDYRSRVRRWI